jgi:CheY-like chemotaxis protein
MNRKTDLALISGRKRLLLVASTLPDAGFRSEFLRRNGYEVDFASGPETAITMSRTRSYDVVLLYVETPAVETLAGRIQRLNPNALVACLADCSKAIPALPCHRMLWKAEPMEYFLARVNALAATA